MIHFFAGAARNDARRLTVADYPSCKIAGTPLPDGPAAGPDDFGVDRDGGQGAKVEAGTARTGRGLRVAAARDGDA